MRPIISLPICALILLKATSASGAVIWADWTAGTAGPSGSAVGVLGTTPVPVNITYTGEIQFIQTSSGTNYWNPSAPYVSATVPNPPLPPDIIALSRATSKTLSFDRPVENLLFAVVSLNGNGYQFDRDFEILSYGQGYWGNGTLTKTVLPGGIYQLNGTGEPHGVIEFTGAYSSITWTSLTNENWNGFTVGVRGVIIPEPAILSSLAPTIVLLRRQRRRR